MIKNLRLKCMLLATALTVTLGINAQNVKLVKDVNPNTDANPSGYTLVNGTSYFTADDGIHGTELWRTDGTAAGTALVKDITPGTTSSNISCLTAFKGKLLFVITNPGGPQQLWASDGTTAGTQLIKNVAATVTDFTINQLAVVDSLVYFVAGNNKATENLWKTNGTPDGTVIVTDLYKTILSYDGIADNLVGLNGVLYFTLPTSSGNELWRSNGTAAGTVMIKDIYPGASSSNPTLLTPLNGRLYFCAYNGKARQLWVTNGKADSTIAIAGDPMIDVLDKGAGQICIIKNTIFFKVFDRHYSEFDLYKYNTEAANSAEYIYPLHTLNGGWNYISMATLNDSLLFFVAFDDSLRQQLTATDINAQNFTVLKTNPAGYYNSFDYLTETQGKIIFENYDSNTGFEPWVTDGTVAGTHIISDILPGVSGSQPSGFIRLKQDITLFTANDGINGFELWRTTGNYTTASMVKDINITSTANGGNTSFSRPYASFSKDGLLFGGNDFNHGRELWKTDGTKAGTSLLKDVLPGSFNGLSYYSDLQKFKNDYIYCANNVTDTMTLWKTDGTTNGTVPISVFPHKNGITAYHVAAGKHLFYFTFWGSNNGPELWVTNGLPNGSNRLLNDGMQIGDVMIAKGDTLFFDKLTPAGVELWMSTGTVESTKMVKLINPHGYTVFYFGMLVFNGKFYFSTNDSSGNEYVWTSDGTAEGTKIVLYQYVWRFDVNTPRFTVSKNKFYFAVWSLTTGIELWASNGTSAGSYMVKDINPGTANADVWNMVDVNGTLFFTANDGVHGTELWKTNGTDTGTVMVKDITPGAAGSNPQYMVNGNGLLYFVLNDTLWQSNGTASGTHAVNDAGLKGLSKIGYLVPSGNNLYFWSYSYPFGYELYVMGANSTLPVTMLSFTGQWAKNDAQLNWVTANELNSSHFNIQRSVNGTAFTTIGQVKAQGTTSSTYRYNYTDVNAASLPASSLYYRLQQVDLDGNANYSNLVRLTLASNNTITIAPNPAHKAAYIISSNTITGAAVTIADMAGHTVYSSILNLQAGTQVPLNIAGIPAGVYNVTIQNGLAVKQQSKLVVQ